MLAHRWRGVPCFLALLVPTISLAADPDDRAADVQEALANVNQVVQSGPFDATWESLEKYEIPEWYKDAKFGVFIHWGVYSVPAYGSEWYPRNMYIDASTRKGGNLYDHHRKKWGPQSEFGYKDFIPMFRAENFDAARWIQLFKDAGIRYVVPVAEHHDGFPMYACSYTKWDASEMGPKRDIIAELAAATRSAGLRFGVSSHRAFNWTFYMRRDDFDTIDPRYEGLYGRNLPWLRTEAAHDQRNQWPPMDQQFKDDWLLRTAELVDNYEPDLVWFDFGIANDRTKTYAENPFADYLTRFAAYYYNHAAARKATAIINYKWEAFAPKAAVLDLERSKMDAIRYPFWQTDTAVSSSSWGYTENQKYKNPDRLIDDLVDIVSKNGCLLLNVGPRPDGTIPEEDQQILRTIGEWLRINGEAIYGSRPWKIYGEGPTGTATGHLSESKNKPFTPNDIRFTTKEGVLYAIGLGWPADSSVLIKSLGQDARVLDSEIRSISLLGSHEAVAWELNGAGLAVELPKSKPSEYAYVLKIELSNRLAGQ